MASQTGRVSGIADRYAGALFELADDAKNLDQVADDLRGFKAALNESDDLERLVRSPVIPRDDQVRALKAVTGQAGMADLSANFICLAAQNRRLFAIEEMIDRFLGILAERRGEVTAHVTAAHALSDAQQERLNTALRDIVGGKVAVESQIDESLLGGLVVKVGSRMYDSSLRTKLQRLETAMKGVG